VQDVKNTIDRLEKLYKSKKYTHKRIWQVAMIMKVRLDVLKNKKLEQYTLSKKYLDFLGKRTKLDKITRYTTIFKY
jgi:aminopeptidase C